MLLLNHEIKKGLLLWELEGYKVFSQDWTCRGFKYEVGKTYEHQGNIEMCGKGFHFC